MYEGVSVHIQAMKLKRGDTREDKEVLKKGLGKNRKAMESGGQKDTRGQGDEEEWGEITKNQICLKNATKKPSTLYANQIVFLS